MTLRHSFACAHGKIAWHLISVKVKVNWEYMRKSIQRDDDSKNRRMDVCTTCRIGKWEQYYTYLYKMIATNNFKICRMRKVIRKTIISEITKCIWCARNWKFCCCGKKMKRIKLFSSANEMGFSCTRAEFYFSFDWTENTVAFAERFGLGAIGRVTITHGHTHRNSIRTNCSGEWSTDIRIDLNWAEGAYTDTHIRTHSHTIERGESIGRCANVTIWYLNEFDGRSNCEL